MSGQRICAALLGFGSGVDAANPELKPLLVVGLGLGLGHAFGWTYLPEPGKVSCTWSRVGPPPKACARAISIIEYCRRGSVGTCIVASIIKEGRAGA
jgi:hypothetical protein